VIVNEKPVRVTLALDCGAFFEGFGWGDFQQPRGGEFVFCTSMSGVEESLTDPSFCRQILVSTVAHIGNTGYNGDDAEADKIWAEGLICRNLESDPSNWRSKRSLKDWIVGEKRFVVEGINTRLLTVLLREEGSQRGIVYETSRMSREDALEFLRGQVPAMDGLDLTSEVSCKQPYQFEFPLSEKCWEIVPESHRRIQKSRKVAVWDFGVKKNTLRILAALGMEVDVLPAHSKARDFLDPAKGYDGILLSNGPGDPSAAQDIIRELKDVLGKKPIFAICLGHQLVANAIGARTFKMKFGHRGIHHPVVEVDAKGQSIRTWISSQNHGFAVDAESLPAGCRVSFFHGDDQSVEGLSLPELDCETVQFHPEAGPGPYDSWVLLDRFVGRVRGQ
jgi:carbamoyl-phosphate synthase small subunit